MRVRTRRAAALIAVTAAALTVGGCGAQTQPGAGPERAEEAVGPLRIGTLLPQTGPLADLMPGPQAAAHLAVSDINEAGGVLGEPVELVVNASEGDPEHPTDNAQSIDDILAERPSFVLGAMSTGMTNAAMPRLTEAGVLMGSPANTSPELSGASDLFFRTAPPDPLQARALATLIAEDGRESVALLSFDDPYGIALRDTLEVELESLGVDVVYGAQGADEEFPTDRTSFGAEGAAAEEADAVVVLAYEQTRDVLAELDDRGLDPSDVFLVDANTLDYSADSDDPLDTGLLEGARGTIPGAHVDEDFRERLALAYEQEEGAELDSVAFAPEAYDAIVLVALAAELAETTDPAAIADRLGDVSGARGGEECSDVAECSALLAEGAEIDYRGPSGIGPLTDEGDPETASIGVYRYDDEGLPVYEESIEG